MADIELVLIDNLIKAELIIGNLFPVVWFNIGRGLFKEKPSKPDDEFL